MPFIAAVATQLPPHRHEQAELVEAACKLMPELDEQAPLLRRLFQRVGVKQRHLALPLSDYGRLQGFAARNRAWLEAATHLAHEAVHDVLDQVGLQPHDVSLLATTTVTGIAVPSLDARLMNRLPFSPNLKRLPLFGLGCLAGAAGIARVSEYLRAHPHEAALFVSVELCSLTFRASDLSLANFISSGLFGDGAAAVLLVGDRHPLAIDGIEVRDSRSVFFPQTEDAMGWEVSDDGFKIVLGPQVPTLAYEGLPPAVDALLAEHDLAREAVQAWVAHPGGPKVLDAMQQGLRLPDDALRIARESLASIGNLSSASVLFVLEEFLGRRRPTPGAPGVLLAMGPAFSAEVVLLRF